MIHLPHFGTVCMSHTLPLYFDFISLCCLSLFYRSDCYCPHPSQQLHPSHQQLFPHIKLQVRERTIQDFGTGLRDRAGRRGRRKRQNLYKTISPAFSPSFKLPLPGILPSCPCPFCNSNLHALSLHIACLPSTTTTTSHGSFGTSSSTLFSFCGFGSHGIAAATRRVAYRRARQRSWRARARAHQQRAAQRTFAARGAAAA